MAMVSATDSSAMARSELALESPPWLYRASAHERESGTMVILHGGYGMHEFSGSLPFSITIK